MLESPAYRQLSLSAHRVLDRIEIELGHHGGNDNGRLPVTYEDFVKYGIDRHAVAPAIRELVALGFIEVTEQGYAGIAGHRSPNRFRLTSQPVQGQYGYGTNDWRKIKTDEDAAEKARTARKKPDDRRYRPTRKKKQKPSGDKNHNSMRETNIETSHTASTSE
jgi:hypothetical protein